LNVTVLYIGSSLLAPLRFAEREINREYNLDLRIAAHNFGSPKTETEWLEIDQDLKTADVVFVIHVMDGENAARLLDSLKNFEDSHRAVIVINCMPELMRRTRMGKLDFAQLAWRNKPGGENETPRDLASGRAKTLARTVASWIGDQARAHRENKNRSHTTYLKLIDRMPSLLKFIPNAGRLRDVKNYLYLFCYFLQPTPANIGSMVLYALKEYVPDKRLADVKVARPEAMPVVGIYHPDAPALFETFAAYRKWYAQRDIGSTKVLDPEYTIGLLLMRPQIISRTRKHYDGLIRAIEAEGLSVLPAISTFMDNREACAKFFIKHQKPKPKDQRSKTKDKTGNGSIPYEAISRVSQIVSLTGFSFVGGPAMNDSEAASKFLRELNRPFRSFVSLDMQTIESWDESGIGLNPIQAGMQIAIPEIDGATEPFVYGGMPAGESEPISLDDRCIRIARRLKRWNRMQTAKRSELRLALMVFCFPPNKGNVGTAADLDVFPSVFEILRHLKNDGYDVEVPETSNQLREMLLDGASEKFGTTANVVYRMKPAEYRRLTPFVGDIEKEWGPAPGTISSFAGDILIQGITLGKVFIGIQPTFGYEGDPMRMMMARSGAPHHGFMAMYTYLENVFCADAVIHVGTHGSLEFMPGKQVGLSSSCWPDRLIGELPNIYIYSVNNPSEGSIAKRRSYAELISYLTPPIENAGVYKDLASLKELLGSYRQATDEREREQLFAVIEESSRALNFESTSAGR
jgi:magnesium chelatase subunit H